MDPKILEQAPVTTWLTELFTPEEIMAGDIQTQIAVSIQRKRKERNLSQKQLAEQLGVSQGMISRWENGEENLTIETIAKIAQALGMGMQNPLVEKKVSQANHII